MDQLCAFTPPLAVKQGFTRVGKSSDSVSRGLRRRVNVPIATASQHSKAAASLSTTEGEIAAGRLETPQDGVGGTALQNESSETAAQIPVDAIPYFAYFSNLNPRKIGPLAQSELRRFPIIHSELAILPFYKLTFSTPGVPLEPALGNIEPDQSSEVHGVLHWVSPENFKKLERSEAVPQFQSQLPSFLKSFLPRKEIVKVSLSQSGRTVFASTFVFPPFAPSWAKPSRRYVNVAIDGARYWKLDPDYIQNVLEKISIDKGPLSGFGIFTEPRPHPLDRPDPKTRPRGPVVRVEAPQNNDNQTQKPDETGSSVVGKKTDVGLYLIHVTKPDDSKKPLYYIPGLDGNGRAALRHAKDLEEDGNYDFKAFVYPYDNRETLESLVNEILYVIAQDARGRPVSIISESMGGALAIMVGIENTRRAKTGDPSALTIDLLAASNPALSYSRSNPRLTWDFLLNLGLADRFYQTLFPTLLLPLVLDLGSVAERVPRQTLSRIIPLFTGLRSVANVLPQAALSHRLKLLLNVRPTAEELRSLSDAEGPKNVGLICSINDNLIPSFSESYRLRRAIPGALYTTIPFGGHSPMADRRFSLASFLRPFSRPRVRPPPLLNERPAPNASILSRREMLRRRYEGKGEVQREKKTRAELREIKKIISSSMLESAPVFIGEENIPRYDGKTPVLFVSNHTILGWLDAALPMIRIMETRGVLVRAAAHPIILQQGVTFRFGRQFPDVGGNGVRPQEMREFGVQETTIGVIPENLSQGRWCMIFPGGAREAFKQAGDGKYELKWPDYPEFVRTCALFGAIVIPVATVGTEDRVHTVVESETMGKITKQLQQSKGLGTEAIPLDSMRSWRGVDGHVAIPPLAIPSLSRDRIYFRFGKGIIVDEACLTDKNKEMEAYEEIQSAVEEGVRILKQRREHDMFRTVRVRRRFAASFGSDVNPPAGPGWSWAVNDDAYLDDDFQPPL